MLVIRGTKKLRDRVKGAPGVDGEESTTALGDWFANALFWPLQVALLVNSRTLLPVFVELAPAATLLERAPAAIEAVLRRHDVHETFLAAEHKAMGEVRIAPTNDRRVVGVMNEIAFQGEWLFKEGQSDRERGLVVPVHLRLRRRLGPQDRRREGAASGRRYHGPSVHRRSACLPTRGLRRHWGYRELLEILANPTHSEYADRSEWIGRPFDPEVFDPSEFEDNLRNGRLAAFDDEA